MDLVYDDGEHPVALEIGSHATHPRAGLKDFADMPAHRHIARYLITPDAPVLHPDAADDGIGTLPLGLFLYAAGRHAAAAQAAQP